MPSKRTVGPDAPSAAASDQYSPVESEAPGLGSKTRIRSVDVMRGMAMAMVIYAHSRIVLDSSTVWPPLHEILVRVSSIASITFMFISGTMISYFLFSGKPFGRVYSRYARRAMLLLLGCHVMIRLAAYPTFADSIAFRDYILLYFPITDTIACAILIGPFIIRYLGNLTRGIIAVLLIYLSPWGAVFYQPENAGLRIAKAFLFGEPNSAENIIYVFYPLVPWLGIFLIGCFMGRALAGVKAGRLSLSRLIGLMRRWAALLLALSAILTIGYRALKTLYGGVWDPRVFESIYPSRTTLLLPAYLAILLMVFSLVVHFVDRRGRFGVVPRAVAVFGRTSLFTYVTQYGIAWSLPVLLGLKYSLNLPGFLVSMVSIMSLCWLTSYIYGRLRGWFKPWPRLF